MSSSSLRALAATVAGIVAIVGAIVVGLLADSTTCRVTPADVTVTLPTPSVGPGDGLGNAQQTPPGTGQPQQPRTTTVPTQVVVCETAEFGPAPAVAALAGAGLAAFVAAFLLLLAARRAGTEHSRPGPGSRPVSAPPAVPAAATGSPDTGVRRAEADRAALLQAAIYVRDRVTSRALSDRLGAALSEAGITTVEPAGAPFDPTQHEAGGSAPSDDPAKVGSIAAVEVPGYTDRGRLLRAPVVTVYQATGRTHGENHR